MYCSGVVEVVVVVVVVVLLALLVYCCTSGYWGWLLHDCTALLLLAARLLLVNVLLVGIGIHQTSQRGIVCDTDPHEPPVLEGGRVDGAGLILQHRVSLQYLHIRVVCVRGVCVCECVCESACWRGTARTRHAT